MPISLRGSASSAWSPWCSLPSCATTPTGRPSRARCFPAEPRYAASMTTRVIVPHRGLDASKSRLSPVLSPDERGDLAAHLLRRVLRLALRPPAAIPFRFGIDSFSAHQEAARSASVPLAIVRRPGLAFDLDTPDDLSEWLRSGVLA